MFGFFLAFISLIFSSACNWERNTAPDAKNKGLENLVDNIQLYKLDREGDTMTYTMLSKFKTEPLGKKKAKDLSQISLVYPKITAFASSPDLRDSLNEFILRELLLGEAGDLAYQSLEERLDNFINDYLEYETANIRWTCEIKIQVVLNTPYLLSLKFSENSYTGGAHANSFTRYLNFNLKTGKKLKLEDLILPETQEAFLDLNRSHVLAYLQKKNWISAKEAQTLNISPAQQFALTERGVNLIYSAYELNLPLSQGDVEILLPYDDFLPLINKTILK